MLPEIIIAFVIVLGTIIIILVDMLKRLGRSKSLIRITGMEATVAQRESEIAQHAAERVTGVAEQAVEQVGKALDVAQEIHKVSGQMDELLGYVVTDADKLDNGKHRKNLRVVGDEEGAA